MARIMNYKKVKRKLESSGGQRLRNNYAKLSTTDAF